MLDLRSKANTGVVRVTFTSKDIEKFKNEMIKQLTQHSKPHAPHPKPDRGSKLVEIDLFDVHFGKLAWGLESGNNYDVKVAERLYRYAIEKALERTAHYKVDRFLFPVGNDFFNVNGMAAMTFNGTPQQEDLRWKKTFSRGWKLVKDSIERLAEVAPVDVIVIPGNHDFESAFYLGEVLSAVFSKDKRINVDNSPPVRKYYHWGSNLIGFTHGKDEKITDLPLIMATEDRRFSASRNCEWHIGHTHRKKEYSFVTAVDNKSVLVRILRALTYTDQWHHQNGYITRYKAGEVYVWDRSEGIINNVSVAV